MRRRLLAAIILASSSGLLAAGGIFMLMTPEPKQHVVAQGTPIDLATIVVAKSDLSYGTPVKREKLSEISWPAANLPRGSYRTIKDFYSEQEDRVVLVAMKANEPIVNGKVSGPGHNGGLSGLLRTGMKAVAIRVNDVLGVGGFVQPGDRVDVLLTYTEKSSDPKKEMPPFTSLLLSNIRVLAVDQSADVKNDGPKLARTVTVEANLEDSQKITLASTVGSLSLVLRDGDAVVADVGVRRVTLDEISGDNGDKTPAAMLQVSNAVAPSPLPVSPPVEGKKPDIAKISVVRSVERTEYSVLRSAP